MSLKQPKSKPTTRVDGAKLKSPEMVKKPLRMGELDEESLAFLGAVQRSGSFTLSGAKAALKSTKSK